MKVRVKEGQKGFIYGVLRNEGEEFTLKDVEHSVKKDSKGKPEVNPAAKQFSEAWMEKVGKSPGRPKADKKEAEEAEEAEEADKE